MRLLILLLILGVGVVFFVQNRQPVTLVFFGNLASFTLPIAGWVLLFTGAGTITSLLWRVLIPTRKPSSANFNAPRSRPSSVPPSDPPPASPRSPSDYEFYSPPQEKPRSQPIEPPASVQPEWRRRDEPEEWDDWEEGEPVREPAKEPIRDFVREVTRKPDREKVKELIFPDDEEEEKERKPPTESVSSQENVTPSDRPPEPESKSTVFEVEQQPKITNRTGSVYSYVYREPRQVPKQPEPEERREETRNRPENKRDRVYDADYRVIRPPNRENPEPPIEQDDDNDWV